jgi:hypothetical protein
MVLPRHTSLAMKYKKVLPIGNGLAMKEKGVVKR